MFVSGSTNKWSAFLLSACVPGAGQLAAGSWTCLAWFLAAGLLAAGLLTIERFNANSAVWVLPLKAGCGIGLCLLSAEHAKRLLETRPQAGRSTVVAGACRSHSRGRAMHVEISLDMARGCEELWRLVSDLPRFLVIDPFHDRVTLMRDRPGLGVDLLLSHNAFGLRFLRFGRIVAWHEGSGYTFTDFSSRGTASGFPHVFIVHMQPVIGGQGGAPLTRLSIHIRGRWTSPLAPAWLGRLWVWLVCREHARLLRKAL
ncbi:MAG TPA: hypothetical protein VFB80_00160 [Pirellulaceae bacterium]|nr:hypothetical protein [Pirellulaceae bacterium]